MERPEEGAAPVLVEDFDGPRRFLVQKEPDDGRFVGTFTQFRVPAKALVLKHEGREVGRDATVCNVPPRLPDRLALLVPVHKHEGLERHGDGGRSHYRVGHLAIRRQPMIENHHMAGAQIHRHHVQLDARHREEVRECGPPSLKRGADRLTPCSKNVLEPSSDRVLIEEACASSHPSKGVPYPRERHHGEASSHLRLHVVWAHSRRDHRGRDRPGGGSGNGGEPQPPSENALQCSHVEEALRTSTLEDAVHESLHPPSVEPPPSGGVVLARIHDQIPPRLGSCVGQIHALHIGRGRQLTLWTRSNPPRPGCPAITKAGIPPEEVLGNHPGFS